MYLFIFESIGTSELLLIGIVALIFLGPRKMPEMARKLGKIMNEFRNTTNEFKATWEREVNFQDEAEALRLDSIEKEASAPSNNTVPHIESPKEAVLPQVREVDPSVFNKQAEKQITAAPLSKGLSSNDKENWL